MTFRDYQQQARRTQNPALAPRERLEHALWGLASEVGEACAIMQKTHQGHELNVGAMRKEIGDVLWMVAELCDVFEFDMGMVAEDNISKLRKRYPDGFSAQKSINRNEEAET